MIFKISFPIHLFEVGGVFFYTLAININTFSFAFALSFFYSFTFFLFPLLPTLFPPGKGPFASLARVSIHHHFYFPLIDTGLLKDRGVAMGKPHCNSFI